MGSSQWAGRHRQADEADNRGMVPFCTIGGVLYKQSISIHVVFCKKNPDLPLFSG